jgi:hypothetical protein
MIWLLACTPSPEPVETGDSSRYLDLPEHSECFELGHVMDEATCLAVVEEDGRYPTVSENKSGIEPDLDDPRIGDPELEWMRSEIQRCTCSCCHTKPWGGPGVYFYDLTWEPVWIDSASNWSLRVLKGDTNDEVQTLPSTDPERFEAVIEAELERRRNAD